MYQRIGKAAYKPDLSNTRRLSEYLDHPEKGFRSVHVAGTNGKGSTSHMLASILQEAGYSVGLYTSPHLKDFRERIKINGKMIPKRSVSAFVTRHKDFFEEQQLSFFEMTVGLAFDYFRREKVDIAIIEVGLGGRLDSTNIIEPEVSVITNIGLDHTQFLGTTLPEIAREKAGIIKSHVPVIIGETTPETKWVFQEIAGAKNSSIYFVDPKTKTFPSDLMGSYQLRNQRTVLTTIERLRSQGWKVPKTSIEKGLLKVVQNTGLLGRWQILQTQPKVICDTAHNKEGLSLTMEQLSTEHYERLHMVLGVVRDKDLKAILPLFPKTGIYYFCAPKNARALDPNSLRDAARSFDLIGEVYTTVEEAYLKALKLAAKKDLIYVGGSTFLVAEVL